MAPLEFWKGVRSQENPWYATNNSRATLTQHNQKCCSGRKVRLRILVDIALTIHCLAFVLFAKACKHEPIELRGAFFGPFGWDTASDSDMLHRVRAMGATNKPWAQVVSVLDPETIVKPKAQTSQQQTPHELLIQSERGGGGGPASHYGKIKSHWHLVITSVCASPQANIDHQIRSVQRSRSTHWQNTRARTLHGPDNPFRNELIAIFVLLVCTFFSTEF